MVERERLAAGIDAARNPLKIAIICEAL